MRFFPAHKLAGIILVSLFFLFFFHDPLFAQASSNWVEDPEVTFAGKSAVRAKQFLDWTLSSSNANWIFQDSGFSGLDRVAEFWVLIRNIAYFLTLIIVLFTAFLLIITRGRSVNIRKQLLVIGGVFLLITFSFAFIEFVYRIIDTVQNFFLRLPTNPRLISTDDLLNIGFQYETFTGFRKNDPAFDESAKVSLFLVKATAITYYIMAGLLLLRKLILWFFIILSPLWVLLLPFPLIRNTAKIWVGEFFRWLFYGPLFAVLLAGLVKLWQNGIPLNFNANVPGATTNRPYETAINILLGGPGQTVSLTNSVNNINTYAQYVIALLMLWIVIILPFILLKIFRDAIAGIFKEDNMFFQKAFGALYPFLGKPGPTGAGGGGKTPTPSPTPPPPSGEGLARENLLPKPTNIARELTINAQVANIEALPQVKTADIVKYAGLSIPSIRDLARMEIQRENLSQSQAKLSQIATPTSIGSMHERSRFSSIQQELLSRSKRGDVTATTILAAAESARTGKPVPVPLGSRIDVSNRAPIVVGVRPDTRRQRDEAPLTALRPTIMPTINRIQTVGIDDYEDVKKMWEENYRAGDVPISDKVKSREEWITQDITKIESVIELLQNVNEEKKRQGLEELAIILPFLLLGGFSDQETIIYLKAKLEGAKKVLTELEQKTKEEDKVLVENKKEEEKEKAMHMEASAQSTPKEGQEVNLKGKIEGSESKLKGDAPLDDPTQA